jgi:hypothetical protein
VDGSSPAVMATSLPASRMPSLALFWTTGPAALWRKQAMRQES